MNFVTLQARRHLSCREIILNHVTKVRVLAFWRGTYEAGQNYYETCEVYPNYQVADYTAPARWPY
jgi:hypothetical protein